MPRYSGRPGRPWNTNPRNWLSCPDCKLCPYCRASGQYGLTRQEFTIVRLLCEGVGTKDMVDQLRVTDNTLKRHLSNIFNKTGVDTRTQLVVFAVAKGLAKIE
jgi:DNA-binding NarL/FixJ family response regulator